jgi:hypothetical protein
MRPVQLLLLSAATLAVAACNPFHRAPVTEVTTDANMNSRWRASLVTPAALVGAVQINGTASMQPGRTSEETSVSLNLANATPGGVHPWQVHRGQCGADEGVLGSADSYRSVKIDDEGNAKTTVTVPMATPTSGSYFVTVSASAANASTIVACGNLAPPAS